MNSCSKLAVLGVSVAVSACTVLQTEKVDYKSAAKAQVSSLEVPPDLSQLSRDNRYAVAGQTVTASGYQIGQASAQKDLPTAASSLGDVRIERAGSQRWLVVSRPADKLWDPVKEFWEENGFLLSLDQANLGIMETDWAENRAKLPQDFVRNTLGKILDSLYSTGERDRFRTRLERNADGGTDIFISHRGLVEVYDSEEKERTVWQPRPADPELEAEFLRRLMVKLGVTQEQAKALVASGAARPSSQIGQVDGQAVVQLSEGFDRAWRRIGLALDRTNFTVEDRDRSKGLYFVRYVAPNPEQVEKGFFSRLFSSSEDAQARPQRFRVSVVSRDQATTVSVQNADGTAASAADAQRIITVLAQDLQ